MEHPPPNRRAINRTIQWFKKLQSIDKFTFVIAIFTAVLAFTSGFQVWAFIQSEKPIVGITDIRLTDAIKVGQTSRIVIEIKNKGKTTAFVRELRLYGDGGMTVPPNAVPKLTDIKPPILPDDSAHVEWDIPQKFPQEYVDGINTKGDYHIWIVGVVKYTDRFGWLGGGEIGFCFYYDPTRGRGVDSFYRCHDYRYEYAN
jgi:hypothetical protein